MRPGITDDKPSGEREWTNRLHEMPVSELAAALRAAGQAMLEQRIVAVMLPALSVGC